MTGLLAALRRLLLAEHEDEHRAITRSLAEADAELTEMAVRLRRLEIELRLRERRLG